MKVHLIKFLVSLRAKLKGRKKNPDWSRVDEPDNILPSFMMFIVGFFVTIALAMFAYAFMNDSLAVWIGTFLALQHSALPFVDQLAAFTAIVIVLLNVIIITAFAILRPADGDDLVEMISDLDENINERIAEFEHTVDERIRLIEQDAIFPVTPEPEGA